MDPAFFFRPATGRRIQNGPNETKTPLFHTDGWRGFVFCVPLKQQKPWEFFKEQQG
jgi:hypothetical protein